MTQWEAWPSTNSCCYLRNADYQRLQLCGCQLSPWRDVIWGKGNFPYRDILSVGGRGRCVEEHDHNWYQQPINLAAEGTFWRDVLGNVSPTELQEQHPVLLPPFLQPLLFLRLHQAAFSSWYWWWPGKEVGCFLPAKIPGSRVTWERKVPVLESTSKTTKTPAI